jgi:hypothetical protein
MISNLMILKARRSGGVILHLNVLLLVLAAFAFNLTLVNSIKVQTPTRPLEGLAIFILATTKPFNDGISSLESRLVPLAESW